MNALTYLEIPDALWEQIEPLFSGLARKKSGGSAPIPFRTLLAGMLYRLKTGCQWCMVPKHYGSKSTLHEHYQRWVHAGIFDKILRCIASDYQKYAGFDFAWQSMDGSLIQAPTRKKRTTRKDSAPIPQIEDDPVPKFICM
jgi:transposase